MNICTSATKRNHGFLVRVNQDRVILDPATGERLGLVFEHIAGVEPLGGMYLDLRSRRRPEGAASAIPGQLRSGASPSARASRPAPRVRTSRSTAGSSGSGSRIRPRESRRWNGCCTRTGRPRRWRRRWSV